MKDAVLLPLSRPVVASWANHSHILSIIARHPDSTHWVDSNYIQLELVRELNGGLLLLNYSFVRTPEEMCQLLEVNLRSRNSADAGGGIVAFLKDCIRNEQYAYLFLNAYYLPRYPYYQVEHASHDPLIFGFDDRKQVFYLSDFHLDQGGIVKYGTFEVSYRQVEMAYRHLSPDRDKMNGIELLGYLENARCPLDLNQVKRYLSDYLNAISTVPQEQTWLTTPVAAYGVEIYEHIHDQISRVSGGLQDPDFRTVHVLHDHKTLMYQRLIHLNGKGYIGKDAVRFYERIWRDSAKFRSLAMKYGITGRNGYLMEAQSVLKTISEREKQILSSVYSSI